MDYIIFLNRIVHDRDCGEMQRRYLNELLGHGPMVAPLGPLILQCETGWFAEIIGVLYVLFLIKFQRWVTGHTVDRVTWRQ